jgi:hypothetical protein
MTSWACPWQEVIFIEREINHHPIEEDHDIKVEKTQTHNTPGRDRR